MSSKKKIGIVIVVAVLAITFMTVALNLHSWLFSSVSLRVQIALPLRAL